MVYTHSDIKASFNHVLDNVLGWGDGTPLKVSLSEEGVNGTFPLSNLTNNDIDSLKYKNKDSDNVISTPIQMANCNLLRVFLIL